LIILLLIVITIVFAIEEPIIPVTPDNISNWQTVGGSCTAGTHYDCVDDWPTDDGESSFVECDTNIQVYDFYNTNSSFTTESIKNVTIYTRVCEESDKANNFAVCVKIGGTEYCDTTVDITGIVCPTYGTYSWFMDDSPASLSEWTVAEVNEMLIGASAGLDCNPDIHMTQVYAIIGWETVGEPPQWNNNFTNVSYPDPQDVILHHVNWSDDTALDGYIFSWNATNNCDTWANDTFTDMTGVINQSNITKQIPSNCIGKAIGWYVWANDSDSTTNITGSEANPFVYNVTPDTEPTKWQFNQTNISSPDPNQAIRHSVNWTDNVGLSAYIFGWNASGSFVNDTSQTLSGLSDWSNVTKTVPGNLEGQIIVWRIWANDSNNNGNETNNQTYVVNSANPVIDNSQHIMNQSVVGANNAVGFGVYVTDNSGNANVTINIEGTNYSAENNYPWFNLTRSCNSEGIGYWNETWANDSSGNWDSNETVAQYWTCDYNEPKWFDNQTNISSPTTGIPVLHSVRWTDFYQLSNYTFEWNASGTDQNVSDGNLSGTGDWSNITQTIPSSAEGQLIRWRVYGNDSFNQMNITFWFYYTVQQENPTIGQKYMNRSGSVELDALICLNVSGVTDAGIGVDDVWTTIQQSNGSVFNETMSDTGSCAGGGSDGWYSFDVNVGDSGGFFYYNTTYVNDSLGNVASNTTALFLTVVDSPPKYFQNETNITNPNPQDPIKHSALWTDDSSLDDYIFSWNGSSDCSVWNNDSLIGFGSTNNSWSNITKSISGPCEGNAIGWYIWANDTADNSNFTAIETSPHVYSVQMNNPVIKNKFINESGSNQMVLYSMKQC
jgi:hypothetical protein